MVEQRSKNVWLCVGCDKPLGRIFGGELVPDEVPGSCCRTSGPNLVITCPSCGSVKTWYTADPIVRSMYQLVHALSSVAAQSMVEQIGSAIHKKENEL